VSIGKTLTPQVPELEVEPSTRTNLGIIKGLAYRAHKLCNSKEDLEEELGFLAAQFIANGYPIEKMAQVVKTDVPGTEKSSESDNIMMERKREPARECG
jgi:hypothetical protein